MYVFSKLTGQKDVVIFRVNNRYTPDVIPANAGTQKTFDCNLNFYKNKISFTFLKMFTIFCDVTLLLRKQK